MSRFFPLFADIGGRRFLIIGGGRVAARRARALSGFECRLDIVAPHICVEIRELKASCSTEPYEDFHEISNMKSPTMAEIRLIEREFAVSDIDGADYVIAATDSEELNSAIVSECRKKSIPVNSASRKEDCDFYFPGIVKSGEVIIGISASGTDHGLVKRLRMSIEETLKKMLRPESE